MWWRKASRPETPAIGTLTCWRTVCLLRKRKLRLFIAPLPVAALPGTYWSRRYFPPKTDQDVSWVRELLLAFAKLGRESVCPEVSWEVFVVG